ncbi:MAG: GumC family protein [Solirubrobacterales bacterium]
MVADDSETLAPTRALSVLWQRRGLIGGIVGGATALAIVALQVIDPLYTGEAMIAINTRSGPSQQLLTTKQSVVTPPLTPVLVSTEIDILESRGLAGQVVDALALDRDPEFNTELKPSILPDGVVALWRRLKAAIVGERDHNPRTATIDAVMKRLSVKSDTDSYAIRLRFDSTDPKKAALVANAFADLYIRAQREAKLGEMQVATDWITTQISRLREQLAKDTSAVVAFRREHNLAPVDVREKGQVAAQQLILLETEIAQVERERAQAEAALNQAKKAIKGGNAMALTFVDESTFLQEMRREEAKLLGRIAEMSVGYRADSPSVMSLQNQLAALRGEMNREIEKQVDRLANEAAQAKAREDVLKARMDQISSATSRSDNAMTELELRQKEIESKNLMLESFLTRYAELTNRSEIEQSDARVASRATAPAKPSYPKPFLFLGVALAGSTGLGISLAFLLERFRTGFLTTRQVRDILNLPTLGIIPDVSKLPARTLPADYLVDRPESVYAEAVRSAQITIMNARDDRRQAVMVTSSLPGEGKTAFTVSLGRSLALAGKKVLVVDCDLRRPSVARQLNAYEVPGIADFLRQQASVDEIVRHDARSGLDFIASGGRTQDPQRLLEDAAVRKLFDRLLVSYDIVLVDTPPTMVSFDAALLADVCDMALYVVEWDATPRRAVEAGVEHLRGFDIPVAGVVLTKVDLDRQRQYSDYVDFCFRSSEYYGN